MDSHRDGLPANHGTRTETGLGSSTYHAGGEGPRAHPADAPVVPKRRRPPRSCSGGPGGPTTEELT